MSPGMEKIGSSMLLVIFRAINTCLGPPFVTTSRPWCAEIYKYKDLVLAHDINKAKDKQISKHYNITSILQNISNSIVKLL